MADYRDRTAKEEPGPKGLHFEEAGRGSCGEKARVAPLSRARARDLSLSDVASPPRARYRQIDGQQYIIEECEVSC